VGLFSPEEALHYLTHATPGVPVGPDPHAPARITHRCGLLPLALGLVAGHIRRTSSWTLTDHADRLDERHHQRRLDTGVELALDLSYQHLPTDQQRMLRLAALHPGQDLDAYAVAALADTDLPTGQTHLHDLCRDHLLQRNTPDRHTFHDLVRAYATRQASDEDPPPQRRAALTRLFDYYLATSAAAMDTLHPAETHRRPRIPPAGTPTPDVTDPDTARTWLDTERPNLIAVAAHTALHGWSTHTTRLSATLFRYLDGGHFTDALTLHGHAHHIAHHIRDSTGQAQALTDLGAAHAQLGQHNQATDHLQQALTLYRQIVDPAGQARALNTLGDVAARLGHYQPATDHYLRALHLYRQTGDTAGEANALSSLGDVEVKLGRYQPAAGHYHRALTLVRRTGDRAGQAYALTGLGDVEVQLNRYGPATDHLRYALTLYRQLGNRVGEAWTLDSLGVLHLHLGQPAQATDCYQQALTNFREAGERDGETYTLNGLGEAAHTAGRPTDALTHHTTAHTIAVDIGARDQQARAHTGLGHTHHTLGNLTAARHHYQHALTLYTDLDTPDTNHLRTHLTTLDTNHPEQQ
jgi:tetratricopeptide (TPR) repeat protein